MDNIQKAASMGVIALGSLEMPILDLYVDQKMVEDWVLEHAQEGCTELDYPLYMRTGVMIPGISGIVALILGVGGDMIKIEGRPLLKPQHQLYALEYGTAATVSALTKMLYVAKARTDFGKPAFFPKCGQLQSQVMQSQPVVYPQTTQSQPTNGACCSPTGCAVSGMYREIITA